MKPNEEYEQELKIFIRDTEARYIDYKKMLEGTFKDKSNFPPEDEFTEWYKDLLKYGKKVEESALKDLKEELTYFRQELNPPFYYPDYWKQKIKEKLEKE